MGYSIEPRDRMYVKGYGFLSFAKILGTHSTKVAWGADLADMQLISQFNREFKLLLCVIDIFSKYA